MLQFPSDITGSILQVTAIAIINHSVNSKLDQDVEDTKSGGGGSMFETLEKFGQDVKATFTGKPLIR